MSGIATCPYCSSSLGDVFLYVRGLAASLHVSARADVGLLSRSDLTQIDLGEISQTETGAQAVIPALLCKSCNSISFKTRS